VHYYLLTPIYIYINIAEIDNDLKEISIPLYNVHDQLEEAGKVRHALKTSISCAKILWHRIQKFNFGLPNLSPFGMCI
jgi:hypothetical protein